jgi:hypothetical protein
MKKKIPIKAILIVVIALISWVVKQNRGSEDSHNNSPTDGQTVVSTPAEAAPPVPAIQKTATSTEDQLETIEASHESKLKYLNGKRVTVTGTVSSASTSKSGHHFLNFSQTSFKVFCPSSAASKFAKGGPAEIYKHKDIAVTGEITLHNGTPQITLSGPDEIRIVQPGEQTPQDGLGNLRSTGHETWTSDAGLIDKGQDSQGLTRVEHVLRHATDQPQRAGNHGVFTAKTDNEVFSLVDEAWLKAGKDGISPRVEGHSSTYLIPMGRKVGYAGGQSGGSRGNPPLSKVFIVVRTGTSEVITAYPR